MRRFLLRFANAVRPGGAEADLAREMASHLALLEDDFRRRGMSADDAREAALRTLGSTAHAADLHRDARSFVWLDDLRWDLGYAARLLRRNPLFALTAALSLAIGIGANTTIFTIANALLFRPPLGVHEADRLLDIFRTEEGKAFPSNFTSSYPYYLDVRQRTTTLAALYAYEFDVHAVSLGLADGTEYAFANVVSTNYFAVLGVTSSIGRLFSAADDEAAGASPIVVLSDRFWRRRFNGDHTMVGQTVQINRRPFVVVGVAAEGFRGTNVASPDLWVPIGMVDVVEPGTSRLTDRRPSGFGMGGRVKPGVSVAQARAELDVIARGLERENPIEDRGTRLRAAKLSSIPGALTTVAAGFFALLLGLVSVVLIIASANVAGVLLARAAARRREIAVRIAIGAGCGRLIRQLLTETMLLCVLGGAGSLALARGMTSLLASTLPAFPIPIEVSLPLDWRVFVFTAGVALVAALLAGLAPALHISKADVVSGLKDESHGPSDPLRTRTLFVTAQVAFSIMLVVLAGLLVRAIQRVGSFDQGFDSHGVELAPLDLSSAGYRATTGAVFARDLVDRVRALPGVQAATLSEFLPGRGGADVRVTVPGVAPRGGEPYFVGTWSAIDSDYFATLRIPLVSGRAFSAGDHEGAPPVIIISQTAARLFWPDREGVGKYVLQHDVRPSGEDVVTRLIVVGVARDVMPPIGHGSDGPRTAQRNGGQEQAAATQVSPSRLMMYVPLQQRYAPRFTLLTRTVDRRPIAVEIRNLVRSMDPSLPMLGPQPLDLQTGPEHVQLRIAAAVAGGVGLVGLLLAGIGVYGVTAYTTARRTREIGIRLALGAQRSDVVGMVLRQGFSLVVVGSAIGLTLAASGSRLFTKLLFGVPPLDPVTFGGAAALFAAIGLAACYVPARRATRIDAMDALRDE